MEDNLFMFFVRVLLATWEARKLDGRKRCYKIWLKMLASWVYYPKTERFGNAIFNSFTLANEYRLNHMHCFFPGNEDCLFLNVYTHRVSRALRQYNWQSEDLATDYNWFAGHKRVWIEWDVSVPCHGLHPRWLLHVRKVQYLSAEIFYGWKRCIRYSELQACIIW